MSNSVRLLTGVGIALVVYWLALLGIPSMPPVRSFIEARVWVSRGDVTQVVILISSVLLMLGLGGRLSDTYGLRAARIGAVARPAFISMVAGIAIIGPTMLWAMSGAAGGGGPGGQTPSGGPLKMIVSVWLLASISEEVFFRGLLMGYLAPLRDIAIRLARTHVSLPVALCALLFALGHLPLLAVVGARLTVSIVATAIVLGLIAGYYREQTGSLLPAIAVHMTFNVVGGIVATVISATRGIG